MDDLPETTLPAREARDGGPLLPFLALVIVGLLLISPTYELIREIVHRTDRWSEAAPPATVRFCDRDYRGSSRTRDDPSRRWPDAPVLQGEDGRPIDEPTVQTIQVNGMDVCSAIVVVHDRDGWVVYGLVGGP
jgi:hypothetical protein